MGNLADECRSCNDNDEPERLVIHGPCAFSALPWGERTASTEGELRELGWRITRLGPDRHAIHPAMLET